MIKENLHALAAAMSCVAQHPKSGCCHVSPATPASFYSMNVLLLPHAVQLQDLQDSDDHTKGVMPSHASLPTKCACVLSRVPQPGWHMAGHNMPQMAATCCQHLGRHPLLLLLEIVAGCMEAAQVVLFRQRFAVIVVFCCHLPPVKAVR
jgi:hypothetical protein